jgi:uncharacterized protein
MNNSPVVWFEIPVADMDRATKFYETVFDLKLTRNDVMGYEASWFPKGENPQAITGALFKGDGYHPGENGPVIYFGCADIETTLSKVEAVGGKVKLQKKDIGPMGYIGWMGDSEGNTIALFTSK